MSKQRILVLSFLIFCLLIIPLYFKLEGPPSGLVRNYSHVYLCINKVFKAMAFPLIAHGEKKGQVYV